MTVPNSGCSTKHVNIKTSRLSTYNYRTLKTYFLVPSIKKVNTNLSSEILQFKSPCDSISDERKRKAQLKANVASKRRFASLQGHWANEPDLTHSNDHTCDTATEPEDGRDTRREFRRLVVDGWVVCCHGALVQEVIAEGNALVYGEPVACIVVSTPFEVRENINLPMKFMKFSSTDSKCVYPGMAIAM
jgi:hypothetical protein